jgi:hypothetical protein
MIFSTRMAPKFSYLSHNRQRHETFICNAVTSPMLNIMCPVVRVECGPDLRDTQHMNATIRRERHMRKQLVHSVSWPTNLWQTSDHGRYDLHDYDTTSTSGRPCEDPATFCLVKRAEDPTCFNQQDDK